MIDCLDDRMRTQFSIQSENNLNIVRQHLRLLWRGQRISERNRNECETSLQCPNRGERRWSPCIPCNWQNLR